MVEIGREDLIRGKMLSIRKNKPPAKASATQKAVKIKKEGSSFGDDQKKRY